MLFRWIEIEREEEENLSVFVWMYRKDSENKQMNYTNKIFLY